MKKVAIVGVEGSGKTVMLAGLGELYARLDAQGYFLSPKNFSTASYVAEKVAKLKSGEWPVATAEDVMQGLDWTLKRKSESGAPESFCELSFLDFPGEVYRAAFGADTVRENASEEVKSLWEYVRNADDIIVLINLKDIISNGTYNLRVQESIWITKRILDYAMDTSSGRQAPHAAIVLSQADSYSETIEECGGAKGVLEKYLPHVAADYGWLDVLAVSAVDKTRVDDDGNVLPDGDFSFEGLRTVMNRIVAVQVNDVVYSEHQVFRVFGTAVVIGGAVGMGCLGFQTWLRMYDLDHLALTATIPRVKLIVHGMSSDLNWLVCLAGLTFFGFLLAVCVKPGKRSRSVWLNRFVLGLLAFGLSLGAALFGEFASGFYDEGDRSSLRSQYAECQVENVYGCVFMSLGALTAGLALAFGCDTGKRRPS